MHNDYVLQLLNIGILNAIVVMVGSASRESRIEIHEALAFLVLAFMVAMVGEYVGGISRRNRDRPAYYVREEWEQLLLAISPKHQPILQMLQSGLTFREIAEARDARGSLRAVAVDRRWHQCQRGRSGLG